MNKLLSLLILCLAVGCSGPEVVSDFTSFNKEAFLAACTQTTADVAIDDSEAVIDPKATTDICNCVFNQMSSDMDFEEFEELDELLVANPKMPLPAEMRTFISDCLITELDL